MTSNETKKAARGDIDVRLLSPDDAVLFDGIADEVFDDPVDTVMAKEFLSDPRHHISAALDGDRLVGFASALHYVHPDKPNELWINEVGVAPDYQMRGIGRRLVKRLLDHGRELGCREAWVLTEHPNQAARALYRSAGGSESEALMVSFKLT